MNERDREHVRENEREKEYERKDLVHHREGARPEDVALDEAQAELLDVLLRGLLDHHRRGAGVHLRPRGGRIVPRLRPALLGCERVPRLGEEKRRGRETERVRERDRQT